METENKKPSNPRMQEFDGMYANDAYKSSQDCFTLRDHFAGLADIPYNVIVDILERKHGNGNVTIAMIADYKAVYKYIEADAMLKHREP